MWTMNLLSASLILAVGFVGPAVAAERIRISLRVGHVTGTLSDNDAAKALVQMLPLLRHAGSSSSEKTGNLPQAPLPEIERQLDFEWERWSLSSTIS